MAKKPAKEQGFLPLPDLESTARLKQMAVRVADTFYVDPRRIKREPGFNQRIDLQKGVRRIKADVLANGVQEPLTIRKEGEVIYLVNGDCRLTTVEELIAEGLWPEDPKNPGQPMPVPCKSEGANVTPVDRLFLQLSLNNSTEFGPLEKGRVYAKIMASDPAVSGAEIARRTGETKQAVSNALCLVNQGSPVLIEAIIGGTLADSTAIEIIKRAGESHEAQESLFSQAVDNATAAGKSKVMPKHIPKPKSTPLNTPAAPSDDTGSTEEEGVHAVWTKSWRMANWNEYGTCTTPSEIAAIGFPDHIKTATLFVAQGRGGAYFGGFNFSGNMFTAGHLPAMEEGRTAYTTERDAILASWEEMREAITEYSGQRKDSIEIGVVRSALDLKLREAFPERGIACDPTLSETAEESADDAPEDDVQPAKPARMNVGTFNLFSITGAPSDARPDGTYHETERLVLEDRPEGFPILHLLARAEPASVCYGYRFGDTEQFPDPSDMFTKDLHPIDAFGDLLKQALNGHPKESEYLPALEAALADAMRRFYPEEGDPEDTTLLAYAPTGAAKADPSALDRIKNSGSSNRDGSGVGLGNDGGYSDPTKQLEKLNKILEEIGDGGDEEKVATANLIFNFLQNESSVATVKNHLLGKA